MRAANKVCAQVQYRKFSIACAKYHNSCSRCILGGQHGNNALDQKYGPRLSAQLCKYQCNKISITPNTDKIPSLDVVYALGCERLTRAVH